MNHERVYSNAIAYIEDVESGKYGSYMQGMGKIIRDVSFLGSPQLLNPPEFKNKLSLDDFLEYIYQF